MAQVFMGVIKNRHGVYHARKKVPTKLQHAVARVLGNGKERQTWLKHSLGTKDLKEANRRAKPVLIEFDQTLARAEALLATRPLRTSLTSTEIKRIAEYHYATRIGNDAAVRREGWRFRLQRAVGDETAGLTDDEFQRVGAGIEEALAEGRQALARGNFALVQADVAELLEIFGINLDPSVSLYRQLCEAVLQEDVRALEDQRKRQAGELISTHNLHSLKHLNKPACISTAFWG